MEEKILLQSVSKAFESIIRPTSVCTAFESVADPERKQIDKDFGGLDKDAMTYEQCATMLIDAALITDDAFIYFVPRLLKAVLYENGNEYFLYTRLAQLRRSILSEEQVKVVDETIAALTKLEKTGNEEE